MPRRRRGEAALGDLRNLGPVSAGWLAAAGIGCREELERLGAAEAFRRVRARGFGPTLNLLWALQGAILDLPCNELPGEMKAALRREVEEG